jgi:hypothetical protein
LVDWRKFTPSNFEYDSEQNKLSQHRVTFNEAVECFFSEFRDSTEQDLSGPFSVDRQNTQRKETEDHFSVEAESSRAHHHGLAAMSRANKTRTGNQDEGTIDRIVTSQSEEDSVWEPPMEVKRSGSASLSLPGDLAARAAFLARLHREPGVDKWVEKIVRERVELEELAFAEAKKKLSP